MEELIRRSDAIRELYPHEKDIIYIDRNATIKRIEAIPAVEPKQGEWLYWNYKCSCCGKALMDYFIYTEDGDIVEAPRFCPNCGARMKGTDNEL